MARIGEEWAISEETFKYTEALVSTVQKELPECGGAAWDPLRQRRESQATGYAAMRVISAICFEGQAAILQRAIIHFR